MADFAISQVEVLGIRLLEPLHEFGQRDRSGFKQQMRVVGHQTIGKDAYSTLLLVTRHPLEVCLIILCGSERLLPLITTDNNVVEQAGCKQTGPSRHECRLLNQMHRVKIDRIVMPDPSFPQLLFYHHFSSATASISTRQEGANSFTSRLSPAGIVELGRGEGDAHFVHAEALR